MSIGESTHESGDGTHGPRVFEGPQAFSRWLDLRPGMTVCIMGAGGKHTLMARLEAELRVQAVPVLLTSTTNLHRPTQRPGRRIVLTEESQTVGENVIVLPGDSVYVLRREFAPGMLQGLTVDEVQRLHECSANAVLIAKTDGARERSLKTPGPGEPVLPALCDVCVVVAGIDCIGRPLDAATVHRCEQAAALLQVAEGTPLTPVLAARLLAHPAGYVGRLPKKCRRLVYLSKVGPSKENVAADVVRWIPHGLYDAVAAGDTLSGRVALWE